MPAGGSGKLPTLMVGKTSGAAVTAAAEADASGAADPRRRHQRQLLPRRRLGRTRRRRPEPPRLRRRPDDLLHALGLRTWHRRRDHGRLGASTTPRCRKKSGTTGDARLPRPRRSRNGLARPAGAAEQPELLPGSKEADAYVHLGSALGAPEAKEEPEGSGTILTAEKPDPTGRLHESENPLLTNGVIEDFAAAGVPTPETPPATASGKSRRPPSPPGSRPPPSAARASTSIPRATRPRRSTSRSSNGRRTPSAASSTGSRRSRRGS